MPGISYGIIGKSQQFAVNTLQKICMRAARQVGTPHGIGKQCVTGYDQPFSVQTAASLGMPRRMQDSEFVITESNVHPIRQIAIWTRRILCLQPVSGGSCTSQGQQRNIRFMQQKIGAGGLKNLAITAYVVEMTMSVYDMDYLESVPGNQGNNSIGIGARIDHNTLPGFFAAKEVAVYLQGADYNRFKNHIQTFLTSYVSVHPISVKFSLSLLPGGEGGRRPDEGAAEHWEPNFPPSP
jgi:hypothetical protein